MFAFVILHYKNITDTIECINSIKKLPGNYKIIVVDNNTLAKKEYKYLQKSVDDVICNQKNIGFAKANNIGGKYAIKKYEPDFLIILNNDIVIQQNDFLKIIQEDYQKYQFDMMGPKIITNQGDSVNPFYAYETIEEIEKVLNKTQLLITIYKNPITSFFLEMYLKIKYKIKKRKIPENGTEFQKNVSLHGCAIVFSRKYYEKSNYLFYPDTFLYHEEDFLTFFRKKNHYISIYDPKLEVYHKEGASLNKTFNNNTRKKKLFRYQEIEKSLIKLRDLYREENKNE